MHGFLRLGMLYSGYRLATGELQYGDKRWEKLEPTGRSDKKKKSRQSTK